MKQKLIIVIIILLLLIILSTAAILNSNINLFNLNSSSPNKDSKDNQVRIPPNSFCNSDTDCIPASCCHPSSCVNSLAAPDCSDIFCTQVCQPGTLDCNQGSCACVNNECQAVIN